VTDGWAPPGAGSAPEPRPEAAPVMVPPPVMAPPPVAAYPPTWPGLHPAQPEPPPAQPDQPAYLEIDPSQNWGLAYPGYRMAGYVQPVPRPPRPGAVAVAMYLTYAGVVISGAQAVLDALVTWYRRDAILASASAGGPPDADVSSIFGTWITVGLVIGLLFWLLPAAGAVVCAELTRRGKNAARIVLACLAGVFALYNLCGAGFVGVAGLAGSASTSSGPVPFTSGATWWSTVVGVLLGGAAVTILVLLVLPATNRYFSPGPGRRFAPSP
jgi:hypothetical protein